MSQNKDLSSLTPVVPDPGKYQWVKGKSTGIDDNQKDRTHTVGVPDLMPGTIIFVHGVNSDGEWYFDASGQFAKGLNQRLGREDLEGLIKDEVGNKDKVTANRYLKTDESGNRIKSPVIPFWWGYQTQPTERKIVKGTDQHGETPAKTDLYGNPLAHRRRLGRRSFPERRRRTHLVLAAHGISQRRPVRHDRRQHHQPRGRPHAVRLPAAPVLRARRTAPGEPDQGRSQEPAQRAAETRNRG